MVGDESGQDAVLPVNGFEPRRCRFRRRPRTSRGCPHTHSRTPAIWQTRARATVIRARMMHPLAIGRRDAGVIETKGDIIHRHIAELGTRSTTGTTLAIGRRDVGVIKTKRDILQTYRKNRARDPLPVVLLQSKAET